MLGIATLAGCAQLVTPPSESRAPLSASLPDDCAKLGTLPDADVAKTLDMNDFMLATLRKFGKTDNAGVCAMSWDERNNVMLAHRNTLKDPNRKSLRPAKKEYLLGWDADDNGNQPTSTQRLLADTKRRAMGLDKANGMTKAAGIRQDAWTHLGPGNVGGRIRAIVFDPRNSNRFFIGAATGGIWLTSNAGQTITPVADFSSNLVIGSMAIDPVNPNNVYAGTGEYSQGLTGIGVFKSADGGSTWNVLAATSTDIDSAWTFTNRIGVHRTDPNIVLAANGGGIYRSANGGQSWTRTRVGATLDLQFDPNNPDRVVASGIGGFAYYSTDAGSTWTDAPKFFTNELRGTSARSEFAWSTSTPNLVFASVDNSDQTSGDRGEVYKSEDGGQTWVFMSSPKHLRDQGIYDNTIWVDPTNSANIVIGGIDLYRSSDGGATFTRISSWQQASPGQPQPHADQHQIVSPPNFSAANPMVYIGNDGGLYRSTDIFSAANSGSSTWQNLNNELGITQFYGGAGSLAAGGKIVGGTQDNGDLRFSSGTTWTRIGGGDGGYTAVDPISDSTTYGEYIYASVRRYDGTFQSYICNGITEGLKNTCGPNATEQTNFISPFILDPNIRDRMLVGANSLWVSDNVRTVQAPTWRTIKPPVTTPNSTRYINAIAVQNGNSNVIWVGHNASNTTGLPTQIFKTVNGLSSAPDWINVAQVGMPTSLINRITIDPDNPNRVWVAYSGFSPNRLWVTENGGTNWLNISAGLPAVTLHDIKRSPTQSNWLYVAAANGVYTSQDSGLTWTSTNDGPNGVRVRELFWYDYRTLIAATYGRGMFKVLLPDTGVISFQPTTYNVSEGAGTVTLTVNRIGSIASAASVNFTTQSGTATSGADFTATSGTLSWPAGDGSTRIISVPITDDALVESSEAFSVLLSNPTGTSIISGTATVNITDNEPVLSFQPASYTVTEGAGTVAVTVNRIGSIASAASVSYSTQSGTATSGDDFPATSGTLNWPAGDGSTRTIAVPIINDALVESAEAFTILLSNPTGAIIGAGTATVNITDNDDVFPPNCVLPTVGWSIPAGANAGWQVATDSASVGGCSLKNLPIGDNAKAQIAYTGTFIAGNVTFDRRVSSESTYDCLQFLIDGVAQNIGSNCSGEGVGLVGASGEVPWGGVSAPITAGAHTLTWSYVKDANAIGGSDAAWIDKLVLPQTSTAPVTLTVTKNGTGLGTVSSSPAGINCGATCNATFTPAAVVTFSATPTAGSYFSGWAGCTSVVGTSCQVTVASATTVTATFVLVPTAPPLAKRGGIDLDGNGSSALIVRHSANSQLLAGRLVSGQLQWTTMADPGSDYRLLGAVDFIGNGKSDLAMLIENPALLNANGQGPVHFWRDFIDSSHQFLRDVKPAWDVQVVGDLDGDGFGDLVWRFRGMSPNIDDQGVSYIWFTNGSTFAQLRKRGGAPLTWTLLGAADLNFDGAADMIYVSPENAMRVLMSTPARTCANLSGGSIPTGFTVLKLADFSGNRRGDVLIRNAITGEVRLISMNATGLTLPAYTGDPDNQNASCTSSTLSVAQTTFNIAVADPAWSYFASGDFNGDGIFDIIWKRPDNTLTLWLMGANGAAPTVMNNIGSVPANTTVFPLQ